MTSRRVNTKREWSGTVALVLLAGGTTPGVLAMYPRDFSGH
jgi:hypothetical protein